MHVSVFVHVSASASASVPVRQMCCKVLCCSVLQCVAVCCSVLQCVAVCCSVAVCCNVRQMFVSALCLYLCLCLCLCMRVFCMFVGLSEACLYRFVCVCIFVCMCMCVYRTGDRPKRPVRGSSHRTETLQHTAIHCNTLQHTATHCNTGLDPAKKGQFVDMVTRCYCEVGIGGCTLCI